MNFSEIKWVGVRYLNVALDTDRWRAVVNTAVNRCVLSNAENCLTE